MSNGRASVTKAGLLAGLFGALLVATPLVGELNWCCCGLVIVTGMFAAWIARSDSDGRAGTGTRAAAGLLAGLVAGAVGTPLRALLARMAYGEARLEADLAAQMEALRQGMEGSGQAAPPGMLELMESVMRARLGLEVGPWLVLATLFACVTHGFFGLLGGLLGAALARRAPGPPAAPPPPAPSLAAPPFVTPTPVPPIPPIPPVPPQAAPPDVSPEMSPEPAPDGSRELRWGGPVLDQRPAPALPEAGDDATTQPPDAEGRGEIPLDELPLLPPPPPPDRQA